MRLALAFALAVTLGLAAVVTQTRVPLKQDLEVLTEGPMRTDRVKDGLYVIRGPFLYCMRGCPPGQNGDGLIHESGDVALRVTPAGLIVVDDKFPDQATDVLAQIKEFERSSTTPASCTTPVMPGMNVKTRKLRVASKA